MRSKRGRWEGAPVKNSELVAEVVGLHAGRLSQGIITSY